MSEQPQTPAETDAEREAKVVKGRTRKTEPKPAPAAKPDELTQRDKQRVVFAALFAAAGDLIDSWTDKRVTKTELKSILSQRLAYTPSATELWDKRLGPAPVKPSTK